LGGGRVQHHALPSGGLEDFVELVVPILQVRGPFRTAYAGTTLRSHLGLTWPEQRAA
jgi:hypothetical protein